MNHNSIDDVLLIIFLILIVPFVIAGFLKGPLDESTSSDDDDKRR